MQPSDPPYESPERNFGPWQRLAKVKALEAGISELLATSEPNTHPGVTSHLKAALTQLAAVSKLLAQSLPIVSTSVDL